jgi:hypothetical protein
MGIHASRFWGEGQVEGGEALLQFMCAYLTTIGHDKGVVFKHALITRLRVCATAFRAHPIHP